MIFFVSAFYFYFFKSAATCERFITDRSYTIRYRYTRKSAATIERKRSDTR